MIYIELSIFIILLIGIFYLVKRVQIEQNKYRGILTEQENHEASIQKLKLQETKLEVSIKAQIARIQDQTKQIREYGEILNSYSKNMDNEISNIRNSRMQALQADLKNQKQLFTKELEDYKIKLIENKKIYEEELILLQAQIQDYRDKRDVINEQIERERKINENVQFYSIQIPIEYQKDIKVINELRPKIKKIDILDKLIYDNYVKKFVDDMIKRVLKNNPSGIYKITRISTGEIYIGKSTDVKARWQQHAKSCYNCGTISHSILHTKMQEDGIWNYTFELLEEVEKERLSEREKYWINFYDSIKYGLNMKEG